MNLTECRICGSKNLHTFLSLGPMPLANSFLTKEQLSQKEPLYPLDAQLCTNCGLVQLGQVIEPETMFCDYAYLTGTSTPMKTHFMELAKETVKRFKPASGYFVIDIGSNDGTLLECFKSLGVSVLGIEPAKNVAKLAQERGIDTICDWFTDSVVDKIRAERVYPDAILATNVFAHVHNLKGLVRNVRRLMNKDTLFIIEVPYLVDMLNKVEFDTIYHEHLSYFSVCPLATLFMIFDMSIVDIERINTHGGSLRLYIQKGMRRSPPSVVDLQSNEIYSNLLNLQPYEEFAKKVYGIKGIKEELVCLLLNLKDKGYKITGYGATAKSTVLLNFCNIGTETLDYISDSTPTKQRLYTPGTHIPIYSEAQFHLSPPDYALLLAWNYAAEIYQKEKYYRDKGGQFIIPFPRPRIYNGV